MSKHSGTRYQLIFTILLVVYAGILVYFAFPKASENIKSLGIKEHFEQYIKERTTKEYETIPIFLYSINGQVMAEREIEIQSRDMLHLSLEALLTGPDEGDLQKGFISYIPKNTELVGVSEAGGTVFAEFSKEIINSRNPALAYNQIENTIRASVTCKDIYIIADGSIINR